MTGMEPVGRVLIVLGVVLLVACGLLLLGKLPWLGRLPGDIRVQRGNWTCSVPLATSLLISLLLTVLLNVVARLLRK